MSNHPKELRSAKTMRLLARKGLLAGRLVRLLPEVESPPFAFSNGALLAMDWWTTGPTPEALQTRTDAVGARLEWLFSQAERNCENLLRPEVSMLAGFLVGLELCQERRGPWSARLEDLVGKFVPEGLFSEPGKKG